MLLYTPGHCTHCDHSIILCRSQADLQATKSSNAGTSYTKRTLSAADISVMRHVLTISKSSSASTCVRSHIERWPLHRGSSPDLASGLFRDGSDQAAVLARDVQTTQSPNAKRQSMSSLGISFMYITCCLTSNSLDCANIISKLHMLSCYGRRPWQPAARPSWPHAS